VEVESAYTLHKKIDEKDIHVQHTKRKRWRERREKGHLHPIGPVFGFFGGIVVVFPVPLRSHLDEKRSCIPSGYSFDKIQRSYSQYSPTAT